VGVCDDGPEIPEEAKQQPKSEEFETEPGEQGAALSAKNAITWNVAASGFGALPGNSAPATYKAAPAKPVAAPARLRPNTASAAIRRYPRHDLPRCPARAFGMALGRDGYGVPTWFTSSEVHRDGRAEVYRRTTGR